MAMLHNETEQFLLKLNCLRLYAIRGYECFNVYSATLDTQKQYETIKHMYSKNR